MKITDINLKYQKLVEIYEMAYKRAAEGKGHLRHYRGEPYTEQWICRGIRSFGLGGAQFQIGKKNEEINVLETKDQKINELLDIINYAAAGIIVLMEEEKE